MDGDVEANMVTNRLRLEPREGAALAHPSDLHRLVVEGDRILELVALILLQLHAGQRAGGRIADEGEAEVGRQLDDALLVRDGLVIEDDQQLQERADVGRQIRGLLAADDVDVAVLDRPQGLVAEEVPVRQACLSGKLREQVEFPSDWQGRESEATMTGRRRSLQSRGRRWSREGVVAGEDRRRIEVGDEPGLGLIQTILP